jgi:threonine dehydrogenase-like Zn-dependent dehydrogenase
MAKVKAFRFVAAGRVELVELEMPAAGPTQAVVRMLASSMCNHPELRSFRGGQLAGYGSRYPMQPGEPGHEGVGEVVEVGPKVRGLAVGDLVAMTGHGGDPTHRSHVCKEADTLARIEPHGRDPKAAAFLEMFGCAYHCVRVGWREAVGFDDAAVAVIGVGAIGLCSVQLLRLWPAARIAALDTRADKLELAARLGATETLQVDPAEAPAALVGRVGEFDFVIECTGHPGGHGLANALARRAIINVSFCPEPYPVHQARWFAYHTTIYNPAVLSSVELKAVANLYNRRLIDPAPMVSRRIAPEVADYVDAVHAIERGEIVKALIEWDAA